jgi:hypothetical protein
MYGRRQYLCTLTDTAEIAHDGFVRNGEGRMILDSRPFDSECLGLDVAASHAALFQILLVVVFGLPKRNRWHDLGCDWLAEAL